MKLSAISASGSVKGVAAAGTARVVTVERGNTVCPAVNVKGHGALRATALVQIQFRLLGNVHAGHHFDVQVRAAVVAENVRHSHDVGTTAVVRHFTHRMSLQHTTVIYKVKRLKTVESTME